MALDYHYCNIHFPETNSQVGFIIGIIFELPLPTYSIDGSGWRTTVLWGDESTKWLWGDSITNYGYTIEYRLYAEDSWHQAYNSYGDPILDYVPDQHDNNYATIFCDLTGELPTDEIQIRIRNKRLTGTWSGEYGQWVTSDVFSLSKKSVINPLFTTSGQYPFWVSNNAPKFPFVKKITKSKVNSIRFIDGGISSYKMRADINEYDFNYNMTDTKLNDLRQFLGQYSIRWHKNSFNLSFYQDGDFITSEVKYVSDSLRHDVIGVNTNGDVIHNVKILLREVI